MCDKSSTPEAIEGPEGVECLRTWSINKSHLNKLSSHSNVCFALPECCVVLATGISRKKEVLGFPHLGLGIPNLTINHSSHEELCISIIVSITSLFLFPFS